MDRKVPSRRLFAGGFTLVELLVVIGIIALLIAVLLPVLRKARDQANKTACMSNLRQIVLGVMLYATDNRDKCPFGAKLSNPGPPPLGSDLAEDWVHWRQGVANQGLASSALAVKLKVKADYFRKLLLCPGDVPGNRWYPYSYSMNMYFEPRPRERPAEAGPSAPKLSIIRRASEKILLAEENERTINDGFWAPGNFTASPPSIGNWVVNWDWLSIRHDSYRKEAEPAIPNTGPLSRLPNRNRLGLVAFADGHVDYIPRTKAHSPEHLIPRYEAR